MLDFSFLRSSKHQPRSCFLVFFSWAIGRSMMITDTMRRSNDDSFIPGVSFSIHFQFMESLIEYDACIGYGVQSGIGSLSGSSV